MDNKTQKSCIAFEGNRCIASGNLLEVAKKVKEFIDREEESSILIFDNTTSEIVEIDFRGTANDVLARLEASNKNQGSSPGTSAADNQLQRKPGRPKLGVVSREVTLLPRHWEWLNSQPGGASVTLRKLVEEARRVNSDRDKVRKTQEVAYRFMSAMAGDLPGFEEAARALFSKDSTRFNTLIAEWPTDIRNHTWKLAKELFSESAP